MVRRGIRSLSSASTSRPAVSSVNACSNTTGDGLALRVLDGHPQQPGRRARIDVQIDEQVRRRVVGRQECARPRLGRQDEPALLHPRQQERGARAGAQVDLLREEHRQRPRHAPEIVGGLRDHFAARVLVRLAAAADEMDARRGRGLRRQHGVETEHAARPDRLLELHDHHFDRRGHFAISLLRVVEFLLPGNELLAPVRALLRIQLLEQLARLGEHAELDVGAQQVVAHGEPVLEPDRSAAASAHQQFGVAAIAEVAAQLHEQVGGRRPGARQRLFVQPRGLGKIAALQRIARQPQLRAPAARQTPPRARRRPARPPARASRRVAISQLSEVSSFGSSSSARQMSAWARASSPSAA